MSDERPMSVDPAAVEALADQLDARAARYRAASRSAGNRADRLAYGGPHWTRAVGLEAYYTGKAERNRIAADIIRETRQAVER